MAPAQEREESKASEDEKKALEDEKLQALRRALALKPQHSGCLYRLGMSLRERGQETEREMVRLIKRVF